MQVVDFGFSFGRPRDYCISLSTGRVMRGGPRSEVAATVLHLFDQLPRNPVESRLLAQALSGERSECDFAALAYPDGRCEMYRHNPATSLTKREPVDPAQLAAFLETTDGAMSEGR